MRRYRSRFQIVFQLLRALASHDQATVSKLMREVNMPYVRLIGLLNDLTTLGLVQKVPSAGDSSASFRLTQGGSELLSQYQKFKEFAERMGLRL